MSEPSPGTPPRFLTTQADDRARLRARHGDAPHVVAAVLCAQWCTTCREFLPMLDALAARLPQHSWVWIDIEDDAALVGDVDIETFPTLAVYVDATLAHFGPVLPNPALVERLVQGARPSQASGAAPATIADVHEDIVDLVRTLVA